MGYAVYEDRAARDLGVERWAGYGVPAICDLPGCSAEIDRGMGYRCEEYTVYRYFDADGEQCTSEDDWEDEREEQAEGCGLHFCSDHLDHGHGHGDDVTPKPDTYAWVDHMLTDDSWEGWRTENPEKTAQLTAALAAEEGTNR